MIPSGFKDPAVAAIPVSGDLYFEPSIAIKNPGEVSSDVASSKMMGTSGHAAYLDSTPFFGAGTSYTASGEAVTGPAVTPGTHVISSWKDAFNFHGSPAPWVLIGILLVAGILHVQSIGVLGTQLKIKEAL